MKGNFWFACEVALVVAAVLIAYALMFREVFISLFG